AKSLVVRQRDEERFTFLETVRAFAIAKLERSGAADDVRRALLDWAKRETASAPLGTGAAAEAAALARLETEHDNLAEAVRVGLEVRSPDVLQLVCGLAGFWEMRGHWTEGRAALERALELDQSGDDRLRSEALAAAGGLA